MSAWRENTGRPPRCESVFVRLRNGIESAQPWKVSKTSWVLTGWAFDVVEWRAA